MKSKSLALVPALALLLCAAGPSPDTDAWSHQYRKAIGLGTTMIHLNVYGGDDEAFLSEFRAVDAMSTGGSNWETYVTAYYQTVECDDGRAFIGRGGPVVRLDVIDPAGDKVDFNWWYEDYELCDAIFGSLGARTKGETAAKNRPLDFKRLKKAKAKPWGVDLKAE